MPWYQQYSNSSCELPVTWHCYREFHHIKYSPSTCFWEPFARLFSRKSVGTIRWLTTKTNPQTLLTLTYLLLTSVILMNWWNLPQACVRFYIRHVNWSPVFLTPLITSSKAHCFWYLSLWMHEFHAKHEWHGKQRGLSECSWGYSKIWATIMDKPAMYRATYS